MKKILFVSCDVVVENNYFYITMHIQKVKMNRPILELIDIIKVFGNYMK